jgi:4-amino-4-deoxychorismate lyase
VEVASQPKVMQHLNTKNCKIKYMSLLIETIACTNRKLQNLFWHSARLNKSRKELFESKDELSLDNIPLPSMVDNGQWKCRVLYDHHIHGISFEPYVPREVNSLKLVRSNINYGHKYHDRDELDYLFSQRGVADDIIIIKNGLVTDTSIANILLFDGDEWFTPSPPLLEGTMRAELISKKVIRPIKIKASEITTYKKIMLVNALNPFSEANAIAISDNVVVP